MLPEAITSQIDVTTYGTPRFYGQPSLDTPGIYMLALTCKICHPLFESRATPVWAENNEAGHEYMIREHAKAAGHRLPVGA
ncbi:MAG: hypothetical protein A2V88_08890 [Elusimicrobia bacterium RBG_16_66_12]|nr:MAG: hypothetical protein A2V88_08890 [Elusimicrobia bacterium RBG_16_66_12]